MRSFFKAIPGFLVISVLLQSCNDSQTSSILPIQANEPFYATYAAAQERSSFLLDEGYEWHFYEPKEPMEFTTDTGGDLGVAWNIDGKSIILAEQMAAAPVISETYPDMVSYGYQPVEDLQVNATFLVRTSREAILELEVLNESDETQMVMLSPYIRDMERPFGQVKVAEEGVYFTHQEYPDGWTKDHNLPHEDSVRNLLTISEADEYALFTQWDDDSPSFPYPVINEPEMLRLQGRTLFPGNIRNQHQAPKTRIQAYIKGKPAVLITENSAVPGLASAVINQDGYYRLDLGLLENNRKTDTYALNYYFEDQQLGYQTELKANAEGRMDRFDALLAPVKEPTLPENISIQTDGKLSTIYWDAETPVHVYKRIYPESKYVRVANSVIEGRWTDHSASENSGYILTGVNADGTPGIHSREYTNLPKASFLKGTASSIQPEMAKVIAGQKSFELNPGESKTIRMVRFVQPERDSPQELAISAKKALSESLDSYRKTNRDWVKRIDLSQIEGRENQLLYLSAANMMKQVFYPPEENSSYNYYVFSREPTWGWGHGGQVFHESLTMMAYAPIEPQSAMESQMVYEERQYENGYINYRTGSYLNEIIEYNDTLTSSAPWYAWQNYEVYKITQDQDFLKKMYSSSARFYNFYNSTRDYDNDGLAEWRGHAVLESVRDAAVAVWDEVGWPANFDGVDVSSMLVMEAKALEQMALELGLNDEAAKWKADYEKRTELINQYMWDEETGFYYNIDRKDNDFNFNKENDLKRMEIIGFLPLWAGIASKEQAEKLVEHLTNPNKFWRPYGVPSLSADDSYYNDKGYWNGPVWVEWNYLIFHGLKQYGYDDLAKELALKNAAVMVDQLKQNHNLWEFYSPDESWAGYHKTYIWAGIINRMLLDMNND